jgi:hypothetical protein
MACPQVADGGDGLQVWRVAANILNKQSQKADNGRSSSLRGWLRTKQLFIKKKPQHVTECNTGKLAPVTLTKRDAQNCVLKHI